VKIWQIRRCNINRHVVIRLRFDEYNIRKKSNFEKFFKSDE
jgi:hypothetical protein